MAWETYKHDRSVSSEPAITISSLGRLSFNKAGVEVLTVGKDLMVELLFDRAKHRIGVKPTKETIGTLALKVPARRNTAVISCIGFLNYVQYDWSKTRHFPATWSEREQLFVVEIPKELFGSQVLNRRGLSNAKRAKRNEERRP